MTKQTEQKYKEELKGLKKNLEDLMEENRALRASNESLQAQQSAGLQELLEQNEDLLKDMIEKTTESIERELSETKERLDCEITQVDKLRSVRLKLEEDFTKEFEKLHIHEKELNEQIKNLEKENTILRKTIEERGKLTESESSANSEKETRERTASQHDQSRTESHQHDQQNFTNEELEELLKELDVQAERICDQELTITRYQEQLQILQSQAVTIEKSLESTKKEAELAHQTSELKISQLTQQIVNNQEEFNQSFQTLQQEIFEKSQVNDISIADELSFSEEIPTSERNSEEITKLTTERDAAIAAQKSTEEKLAKLNSALRVSNTIIGRFEKENSSLLERAAKARSSLEDTKATHDTEITKLKSQHSQEESKLRMSETDLSMRIALLTRQNESLNEELSEARRTKKAQEDEIASLTKRLERTDGDLLNLREISDFNQRALEETESSAMQMIDKAMQENALLKKNLDALNAALEESQNSNERSAQELAAAQTRATAAEAELDKAKRSYEEKETHLLKQLEELRTAQNTELHQQLEKAKQTNGAHEAELTQLKTSLERMIRENADLTTAKADANQTIERYTQEKTALEKERDAQGLKLKAEEERLKKLSDELTAMSKQLKQAKKASLDLEERATAAEKKVSELNETITRTQEELRAAKQSADTKSNGEFKKIEASLKAVTAERDKATEELDEIRKKLSELQIVLVTASNLQREKEAAEFATATIRGTVASLEDQILRLNKQITDLKKYYEPLESQLKEAKKSLSSVEKERDAAKKQSEHVTKDNGTLKLTNSRLNEELETAQTKAKEASELYKKEKATLETEYTRGLHAAQQQFERQQQGNAELRAQLEAQNKELGEMRSQLSLSQERSSKELEILKTQLANRGLLSDKQHKKLEENESEIAKLASEIESLQKQVAQSDATQQKTQATLDATQEELARANEAKLQTAQDNAQLTDELGVLRGGNSMLKQQLIELQRARAQEKETLTTETQRLTAEKDRQLQDLSARLAAAEQRNIAITQELQRVRDEIEAANTARHTAETETQRMKEVLQQAQTKRETQERALVEESQRLFAENKDLKEQLRTQGESSTATGEMLQAEIEEKSIQLATLQKDLSLSVEDNKRLNANLIALKEGYGQINLLNHYYARQLELERQRFTDREAEYHKYDQGQLEEFRLTIESLREEHSKAIEDANKIIQRLQAENADLISRLKAMEQRQSTPQRSAASITSGEPQQQAQQPLVQDPERQEQLTQEQMIRQYFETGRNQYFLGNVVDTGTNVTQGTKKCTTFGVTNKEVMKIAIQGLMGSEHKMLFTANKIYIHFPEMIQGNQPPLPVIEEKNELDESRFFVPNNNTFTIKVPSKTGVKFETLIFRNGSLVEHKEQLNPRESGIDQAWLAEVIRKQQPTPEARGANLEATGAEPRRRDQIFY